MIFYIELHTTLTRNNKTIKTIINITTIMIMKSCE